MTEALLPEPLIRLVEAHAPWDEHLNLPEPDDFDDVEDIEELDF